MNGIQARVREWVVTRLGLAAMDPHERVMRLLEETVELAQTLNVTRDEALRVVNHVHDKALGSVEKELGAVAFTLLATAEGCHLSLGACLEMELVRIESMSPDIFRQHQADNVECGIGAPVKLETV
jgi:NTP pyrophosphatase (non-canonical NTP hydrolase)